MKYRYLFIFPMMFFLLGFTVLQQDIPIVKKIAFEGDSLFSLKGTIYLPNEEKPNKIVIYLPSVWHFIDPDFASPIDSIWPITKYIQSFTDNKIAVLLLNRGNYLEAKEKLPLSVRTLVTDAEKAIKYLRSKDEFKKLPIGIMGVSEAGCATSILASKNKDVSFAILVSTPSVSGLEEHEFNRECGYSTDWLPLYFSEAFADSIYYFEGKRYVRKYKQFDSLLYHNFFKGIEMAERKIIPCYENYDSITRNMNRLFIEMWKGTDFRTYCETLQGGKIPYLEWVQRGLNKLLTPQYIEFSRWNPNEFLINMHCPVLMLYGKQDLNINIKDGLINLKHIINDNQLNNIVVKIYSNLDHNLLPFREELQIRYAYRRKIPDPFPIVPDIVCGDIIDWVNKINE